MESSFFAVIHKQHGDRDVSLWLPLWLILLSCGWLLPNHVAPWASFHQDAWISMMFLFAGVAIAFPYRNRVYWTIPAICGVALSLIPLAQYLLGSIEYFGTAWIAFLYILGFSLAIQFGYHWQRLAPNQGMSLLFSAMLIAGILNSGIIFLQITDSDLSAYIPWVIEPMGPRPFGNFAQPNNMATFVVWGMLCAVWLFFEKHIGKYVLCISMLVLFVALVCTQSRAALLSLMVIVSFSFFRVDRNKISQLSRISWLLVPVAAFALMWAVPYMFDQYSGGSADTLISRSVGERRFDIYKLFLDAAFEKFWIGYGVNQGAAAQMDLASNHAALDSFYFYAHNLFIDLMVWLGIPLGLTIGVIVSIFLYKLVQRTENDRQLILQCMIAALMIHGMLELPLYYAYFIVPFGFIVGGLVEMKKMDCSVFMGRWMWAAFLIILIISLMLTIVSYLGVEESYSILRQRAAKIQGANQIQIRFDHWPVDQFNAAQQISVNKFSDGVKANELQRVENSNRFYPSHYNLLIEAKGWATYGDLKRAQTIINNLSKVSTRSEMESFKAVWSIEADKNLSMRDVHWDF